MYATESRFQFALRDEPPPPANTALDAHCRSRDSDFARCLINSSCLLILDSCLSINVNPTVKIRLGRSKLFPFPQSLYRPASLRDYDPRAARKLTSCRRGDIASLRKGRYAAQIYSSQSDGRARRHSRCWHSSDRDKHGGSRLVPPSGVARGDPVEDLRDHQSR